LDASCSGKLMRKQILRREIVYAPAIDAAHAPKHTRAGQRAAPKLQLYRIFWLTR
jgi:hypothetical protein